jgi:hypothetical protein
VNDRPKGVCFDRSHRKEDCSARQGRSPSGAFRGLASGIDGAALVMAGAILTVLFYRSGHDLVAAGFLIFAIGEGTILSGAAMDVDASSPSFCNLRGDFLRLDPEILKAADGE